MQRKQAIVSLVESSSANSETYKKKHGQAKRWYTDWNKKADIDIEITFGIHIEQTLKTSKVVKISTL